MRHLTQAELAARWQLSPRTLERWRSLGKGPKFLKAGERCIYPLEEVTTYERVNLRQRSPGRKKRK